MRRIGSTVLLVMFLALAAQAGDLYKVKARNSQEAARLSAAMVDPIIRLNDGFLVLTDAEGAQRLRAGGLNISFISGNVDRDRLALDGRLDSANVGRFSIVYEEGDLRLFLIEPSALASVVRQNNLDI